MHSHTVNLWLFLVLLFVLTACSSTGRSITEDQATIEYDLLFTLPEEPIAFDDDVRPVLAFLRIRTEEQPGGDIACTMIANKAYKNVTSLLEGEKAGDQRDYEYDTQTIVRWLEGSYPNFFYDVELDEIESFVGHYNAIGNRGDYERFVARYGVRRTNERFWELSDCFNVVYKREQPRLSGIYDLNRYHNR